MAVNRRRNLVLVGAQRKQHTVPRVHSNEALRRARGRYRGWLYAPGSSQWWLAAAAILRIMSPIPIFHLMIATRKLP